MVLKYPCTVNHQASDQELVNYQTKLLWLIILNYMVCVFVCVYARVCEPIIFIDLTPTILLRESASHFQFRW
jgi:hypothetical protein